MKSIIVKLRVVSNIQKLKMPFYAVAKGKKTGIFSTWKECQEQITGFGGAVYKKFGTEEEAEKFVQEKALLTIDKRKPKEVKNDSTDTETSKSIAGSTVGFDAREYDSSRHVFCPTQNSAMAGSLSNKGLSPTLLEMRREMKSLQKQLSDLRAKFDDYVYFKVNSVDSSSSLKRSCSEESDDNKPKKTKLIEAGDVSKNFKVNSDGFLVAYTDGSCVFNGRNGAKAGVGVYFGENHPMNVSEPVKGRATNNNAEIQAATYALELAKSAGFDKVMLNTDSQFMINCATSWMTNWKKNDWKKRDGSEVVNREELIELDNASEGLLVKWNHIKGHDGEPGNEAADKLAREGAKRYKAEEAE